jgi:nucleoid-associated protein YgaU
MHSVHTLITGDTLDRIAARYYRDPTRWRLIAERNGIVDPLALPIGSPIYIPDLPVRGRG